VFLASSPSLWERLNFLLAELGEAPLPEQDYLPLRATEAAVASFI
jgi:hypothetical protein